MDTFVEILELESKDAPRLSADKYVRVCYDRVLPRLLDLLDAADVRGTFMLVGRDALIAPESVRQIRNRGHEIGNHTQNHPKNLIRLSSDQQAAEIRECQETLAGITGERPASFRAPGYAMTDEILEHLRQEGIRVDISLVSGFFYLFAKRMYGLLAARNPDALVLGGTSALFSMRWIHRAGNGIIRFPVSNVYSGMPAIIGFWFHAPRIVWPMLMWRALQKRQLCVNFHLLEFVTDEDMEEAGLTGRKLPLLGRYLDLGYEAREEFVARFLRRIRMEYDVILLRELADNFSRMGSVS